MRIHIRLRTLALWLVTLVVIVMPVSAQTSDARRWEVEIHGGGVWPTNSSRGTATPPEPGQVFTTATSMPTPPPPSRRESSWYFGDGAVLFNQAVIALFGQAVGGPSPAQIATLNPVLGRPLGVRKSGAGIGISVSRAFTPRLSAEMRVDYSRARVEITESNTDAIEATRASFIPAFEGMIRFNPNRVLNNVTSTAALQNGRENQLATSGALVVNLRTTGDVIPFAVVGAGLVSTSGEMSSSTLRGNYQFRLPGGPPIDETDSVTVRVESDDLTFAGILGGGVRYFVSPRWGIRLDVRVAVGKSAESTVVDAAPAMALGLQPAGRGVLGGNPSIQFSNNSSDPVTALGVTAVAASSLTGSALTGFRTFSGSGVVCRTNFMTGVFWRF